MPRGPFDMRMLRIGKVRDGSKVGVFIYCQQHAREWVTPITCVETAERLVRNYATDPTTKSYVDNLDIFILPSVNPDGGHALLLRQLTCQRKNMVDYCPITATNGAIGGRNNWGVDLNRNNRIGSIFDGYFGAEQQLLERDVLGPVRGLRAGDPQRALGRRHVLEHQVRDQHPHARRLLHVGAGRVHRQRPRDPAGAEHRHREVLLRGRGRHPLAHQVVARTRRSCRNRTGPIADVLYSAAGNSADDQYYRKGIIAYSFEAGAQRITVNPTTGAITRTDVGFQPCFQNAQPPAGFSGSSCTTGNPPVPNPLLANEGHDSAMEFAEGNFGLLQGALEYSQDVAPPVTNIDADNLFGVQPADQLPVHVAGRGCGHPLHDRRLDAHGGLDAVQNQGPRRPGQVLTVSTVGTSTVKWFGTDMKGNQEAARSQTFIIDQTLPTVTFTTPATEGAVYTQGRPVPAGFSCADAGGAGVASCVGSTANGSNLDTSTPGTFTLTVTARDAAGNETVATRSYTVIPAVNTPGNVGGSVGATLSLTMGAPPSFGAFTPGVGKDYAAQTTANVISTAGDAALSVADPSSNATGHLVNGTFSLPQVLMANAGGPFAAVGGSAAPTLLKSWTAPTSNESVTINLKQTIGANDALRTGAYSKTLTFTLSTTTP